MTAKPNLPLIAIGALKAYIEKPSLFIMGTIIQLPKLKLNISAFVNQKWSLGGMSPMDYRRSLGLAV